MNTKFKVVKAITNNVVRARNIDGEDVILIGKGIGFQRRPNDILPYGNVENIFVLADQTEQQQYTQLMNHVSESLLDEVNEVIMYIQQQVDKPLHEHIHVALTDHIAFLVKRCKMGIPIENPFMFETEALYPKEHMIAKAVVDQLRQALSLAIPDGEIGFITLHIVSSLNNQSVGIMQRISGLIAYLIRVIEESLHCRLNHASLNYVRLVTHLRFAIERIERGESMSESQEIEAVLKNSYPECYDLAWKLVKIMQREIGKNVDDAEAIYLGLHLYRFIKTETYD